MLLQYESKHTLALYSTKNLRGYSYYISDIDRQTDRQTDRQMHGYPDCTHSEIKLRSGVLPIKTATGLSILDSNILRKYYRNRFEMHAHKTWNKTQLILYVHM